MKEKELINQIHNINYQTQLLESVGWDENQLASLLLYLDDVLNDEVLIDPRLIIKTVEENFSFESGEILKSLFSKIVFENNLHIAGDNIEH